MSRLSWRVAIHIVVLLSLTLSSCGPVVRADLSRSALTLPDTKEYPKYQPSDFEPPKFEHPEPRIGERPEVESVEDTDFAPAIIDTTPPTPTSVSVTPTAVSSPMPQEGTELGEKTVSPKSFSEATIQSETLGDIEWILNGNADTTTVPGAIKLTDDDYMQAGSAWAAEPIDMGQDFDMEFVVYLGERRDEQWGGDGIAFVLQAAGTSALGGLGGGLGYYGISPSVAVEIDTFWNDNLNDPLATFGNNLDNHVALLKNGNVTHDGTFLPIMPF